MDDIHSAIGREQLKKLDSFNAARQENAAHFIANISNDKLVLPQIFSDRMHVFHQFTLSLEGSEDRDKAVEQLNALGIGVGVHYPLTINEQESFTALGYNAASTPNAVCAARSVLSIPVHPALSPEDRKKIVEAVNSL
jgi:perosamine synthetase